MKKCFFCFLLALALLLSGCGDLFARDYEYAAPYTGTGSGGGFSGPATEISNYNMLKSALLDMIGAHAAHAAFRFSRYSGSVADDLAAACLELKTGHPLGAWAVESISYDSSRIVSYYVADVEIVYQRTAEEISAVVGITGTEELTALLRELLENGAEGAVLRAFSAQVDEGTILDTLERLCDSEPVRVPVAPETRITAYPAEGLNRIYELKLDYGFHPATLRRMAETGAERAAEIAAGLSAESEAALALAAAEALGTVERTSGGAFDSTAYGALSVKRADSRGIALAYKALCDDLGLDCLVVRGLYGGATGEEHCWNILTLDGQSSHVDVSRFAEDPAASFLLDDAGVWGAYIWDTDRYPACEGSLRYRDLAPEPQADEGPPPEPPQPQETEPPQPQETEPAPPAETPEPAVPEEAS